MTTLYIDADACPVKDEALKVAERHALKVFVVANGGIRPSPHPLVETVIVPEGPDAADMWIADRIGPGDICVTGDIPLAARCIEAGGRALKHNGDLRAANPLGTGGGGKPFGKADRSRFLEVLERMVCAAKREEYS
jgi:uncharacterized protein YaiI (UPF0178 family)